MKASTQCVVFILLLSFWHVSHAKEWQVSVSGGTGEAYDPSNEESERAVDITNESIFHIVANRFERNDDIDTRLYTEFFLASNVLTGLASIRDTTSSDSYETEVKAYHMQIGGIYEWSKYRLIKPYFAMTGGVSHYIPEKTKSETYPSASAGLGAKVWITKHLGLKLEARALATLLDTSTTIFCDEEENCNIGIDGSVWAQQHYTAGVTWSF